MYKVRKQVVYTCIVDDYDWLLPPIWRDPSVSFVCFTNSLVSVDGWEVIDIDPSLLQSMPAGKVNRFYKFFPYKFMSGYEECIYVDGNIRVLNNPFDAFSCENDDLNLIKLVKHPKRSNVWDELDECLRLRKIDEEVYESVYEIYLNHPCEREWMSQNNIIYRRNAIPICGLMEAWWSHTKNTGLRDQLALPLAMQECCIEPLMFDISPNIDSDWFGIVPHRQYYQNRNLLSYVDSLRYHGRRWRYLKKFLGWVFK